MKLYDLVIVVHPDLEVDMSGGLGKIEAAFGEHEAKVKGREDVGKQKLAYPIAGQQFGIYLMYQIEAEPGKLSELARSLDLADEVLRYMISRPAVIKPPKAKKSKPKTAEAKPATTKTVTKSAKVKAKRS